MAMNYKEVPKGVSEKEAAEYATGIGLVDDFVNSLKEKGLLPERFSKPEVSSVVSPVSEAPAAVEAQPVDLVSPAIAEYKKGPLTPELLTKIHQTIWREREARLPRELRGTIKFEVTPCPFTKEELAAFENQGLRLGYLPATLATQENRYILGNMFPKMQSISVREGNAVTNDRNPYGWFDYEISIDAPYLGTTETQLADKLREQKRTLLSGNQYIVAGQDSKLFGGRYLDEGATLTRLGSRGGGLLVDASFGSDGRLFVDWLLFPRDSRPYLGGRSSGVNRA